MYGDYKDRIAMGIDFLTCTPPGWFKALRRILIFGGSHLPVAKQIIRKRSSFRFPFSNFELFSPVMSYCELIH